VDAGRGLGQGLRGCIGGRRCGLALGLSLCSPLLFRFFAGDPLGLSLLTRQPFQAGLLDAVGVGFGARYTFFFSATGSFGFLTGDPVQTGLFNAINAGLLAC